MKQSSLAKRCVQYRSGDINFFKFYYIIGGGGVVFGNSPRRYEHVTHRSFPSKEVHGYLHIVLTFGSITSIGSITSKPLEDIYIDRCIGLIGATEFSTRSVQ